MLLQLPLFLYFRNRDFSKFSVCSPLLNFLKFLQCRLFHWQAMWSVQSWESHFWALYSLRGNYKHTGNDCAHAWQYVHASDFRTLKPASWKNRDFRDSIGLSDCHILNGNKCICKARNPASTFKYRSIIQGLSVGASGARVQQVRKLSV